MTPSSSAGRASFPDETVATAILDRVLHHCPVVRLQRILLATRGPEGIVIPTPIGPNTAPASVSAAPPSRCTLPAEAGPRPTRPSCRRRRDLATPPGHMALRGRVLLIHRSSTALHPLALAGRCLQPVVCVPAGRPFVSSQGTGKVQRGMSIAGTRYASADRQRRRLGTALLRRTGRRASAQPVVDHIGARGLRGRAGPRRRQRRTRRARAAAALRDPPYSVAGAHLVAPSGRLPLGAAASDAVGDDHAACSHRRRASLKSYETAKSARAPRR
jgi:hypothetical protein